MMSFLLRVRLLGEDFAWEGINIDAAIAQDFDAVMPIHHGPVWPDFQRSWLSRLQRRNKLLSRQLAVLRNFYLAQRTLRV